MRIHLAFGKAVLGGRLLPLRLGPPERDTVLAGATLALGTCPRLAGTAEVDQLSRQLGTFESLIQRTPKTPLNPEKQGVYRCLQLTFEALDIGNHLAKISAGNGSEKMHRDQVFHAIQFHDRRRPFNSKSLAGWYKRSNDPGRQIG
jgi:hypothetical protein